MWRRQYNGYFTVEAALMIPLILILYLFIIYMAFFQYDRCLLTQEMYVLALRGSREIYGNYQTVYHKVRKEQEDQYIEKYVAMEFQQSDISVSKQKVTVQQKGGLKNPFWNTEGKFPEIWEVSAKRSSRRIRPAVVIRECRRAERAAEALKEKKQ